MTIEVTGVNTWNKGAELMLVAVREHVRRLRPEARLVVDPWFGTYAERARHGLWLRPAFRRPGRSRLAFGLMPPSFRRLAGLVAPGEVDVLLDASGFAFGDQHPQERVVAFAEQVEAARAAGRRVVLLPQALGPFRNPGGRDAFRRIVQAADLVFARDEISLGHAREAAGDAPALRLAPDFTNLVKPVVLPEEDVAWIVPNARMVEKAASRAEADAYVPLLATCIREVERVNLRPRVLIHGRDDASLVDGLARLVGHGLDVVREEDAVAIKRRLGSGRLVVASRFHALVSALSQGVPSIATSWSHKYEMLFKDYGCEDMILPVPAEPGAVASLVAAATGPGRASLAERIVERGRRLEEQTRAMWQCVDQTLGLAP